MSPCVALAVGSTGSCLHPCSACTGCCFSSCVFLIPPSMCLPSLGMAVPVVRAAAMLGWSSWECREGWPPRRLYFHADKDQSFSLCGSAAVPGRELSHPSQGGGSCHADKAGLHVMSKASHKGKLGTEGQICVQTRR